MFRLYSLLLIASLFGSSAVYAEKLYKWTDEEGNVHYSQKPRNDVGSEEVIQGMPPEVVEEPQDTTPVEVPLPTDVEASQQLADTCQGLYHELELYETRQPISDSEGNVVVLSEEMREAKIFEIKGALDESCR